MLEHIFGSKTRLKLLQVFFQHGDKNFYLRELARLIGTQINAIRREISNLLAASIIVGVEEGNGVKAPRSGARRKYFKLNEAGLLNKDLQSLLVKERFFGQQKLIDQLDGSGKIDWLLLSGSFTGSPEAPTDLLVVGDVTKRSLEDIVQIFEKEFGQEVRYTTMKTKEFLYRRAVADRFLSDLLSQKHVVAIDRIKHKT